MSAMLVVFNSDRPGKYFFGFAGKWRAIISRKKILGSITLLLAALKVFSTSDIGGSS